MSAQANKKASNDSSPTPFVVPVFIPHAGCPQRCVFCDQQQTTGAIETIPSDEHIEAEIARFLGFRRDPRRWTEISFYGGNFLGLAPERIRGLLSLAAGFVRNGQAQGIRFSTRPDTIDPDRLALLSGFPVTTIEIGVQSLNDAVLAHNRRGHTSRDTLQAVRLVRERTDCRLGLQVMIGMAGDDPDRLLDSVRQLVALAPDFVRIYPLLVLKGSALERWYDQGRYRPLTLDQAVDLTAAAYRQLTAADICVVRMGLQPTADLNPRAGVVAGPFHPAFGELVRAAVWRRSIERHLVMPDLGHAPLLICVHPRNLSQVKGQKNENVEYWRRQFHKETIVVQADPDVPRHTAVINGRSCPIVERKSDG